jgi:cytochrome P450
MRWISPVGTATRQVVADTELSGVRLPAGAMVAGVLSSANRDEQRWTEPDAFQLDRAEGASLAFSHGPHVCLGAWLGRQTMRVAVQTLWDRWGHIELVDEPSITGFEFRGPEQLIVQQGTAP